MARTCHIPPCPDWRSCIFRRQPDHGVEARCLECGWYKPKLKFRPRNPGRRQRPIQTQQRLQPHLEPQASVKSQVISQSQAPKMPSSFQIARPVVFPDLHSITWELVCDMLREDKKKRERYPDRPYTELIKALDGPENATNFLMSFIDSEVKSLQGRLVTVDRLHDIRKRQTSVEGLWRVPGGYLSYITDDRNPDYLRFYIGQSKKLCIRIQQHIYAMNQGLDTSLHYHVMLKHHENRSANFIRLWSFNISVLDDMVKECLLNILELIMARAFQSLPSKVLENYFGRLDGTEQYSGLGLNILSPMLQGTRLDPSIRSDYMRRVEESLDPDIKEWPALRRAQKKRSQNRQTPSRKLYLTNVLCQKILDEALTKVPFLQHIERPIELGKTQSQSALSDSSEIESRKDAIALIINRVCEDDEEFVPPIGSRNTSIGMVYDPIWSDQGSEAVPWGLKESGFNESNSLIWPYNFRNGPGPFQSQNSIRLQSHVNMRELREANSLLVDGSQLKLIIMFGGHSEKVLVSEQISRTPIRFELPFGNVDGFLELDSSSIRRIYLRSPIPLGSLKSQSLEHQQMLGDLFRFVALATQTSGIRPFFCESGAVIGSVIRLYAAERDGQEKMTVDSLPPGIRGWLVLKGFTEDAQLRALQDKGDSLIHAILMLIVSLPYCPKEYRTPVAVLKSTKPSQRRFDRKQLEQVRSFYQDIWKPRPSNPSSRENPSHESDETMPDLDEIVDNFLPERMTNYALSTRHMEDDAVNRDDLEDLALGIGENEHHQLPSRLEMSASRKAVNTDPFSWSGSVQSSMEQARRLAMEQGRKHPGTWGADNLLRVFVHGHLSLRIPDENQEGYQHCIVNVELEPEGQEHKKCWALQARNDDCARRLGFRVTLCRKRGNTIEETYCYPQNKGYLAPHKANAFVDWLKGKRDEDIIKQPRRFLWISPKVQNVPSHMKPFQGGGYMDDNCSYFSMHKDPKLNQRKRKLDDLEING